MKFKKIVLLGLIAVVVLFQAGVVLGEDCTLVAQDYNEGVWKFLGTYQFDGTTPAKVTVKRETNDRIYTSADAVRFVNVNDTANPITIDDEGAGFSTTGNWVIPNPCVNDQSKDGWYQDDFSNVGDGNPCHNHQTEELGSATWTASLAAGTYNVYAAWTDGGEMAQKVPYCVSGYTNLGYGVTSEAGSGGGISPEEIKEYSIGATPFFTITPTPGANKVISNVYVNGISVYDDLVFLGNEQTASAKYTFPPLDRWNLIKATFTNLPTLCNDLKGSVSCDNSSDNYLVASDSLDSSSQYYRFTVSERKYVKIFTTGPANIDTRGWLYKNNCTSQIEYDDNDGDGNNFLIDHEMDPGDYYIRVQRQNSYTGAYNLHIQCDSDQSGSCDDATSIACGGSASGDLGGNDDYDYFTFTLSERKYVKIHTEGSTDTRGYLYQDNCTDQIENDNNDWGGDGHNFLIDHELDAGTYYVRVRNYNDPAHPNPTGNTTGPYSIHIECVDDQGEDCASASAIVCDSTTNSEIQWQNDKDYYRFELPAGYPSLVEIFTTGQFDTYGYLLSDTIGCDSVNNGYIARDGDIEYGVDNNFKIEEQELLPGTYY
ncbi:MAG: hypothetical protein B6244_14410, partial [Candidatus Cloacimonetes bacterium 4572_55]